MTCESANRAALPRQGHHTDTTIEPKAALEGSGAVDVDIQDNPASISYYQLPPPELKWNKERRGPAPWRSLE